MHLYLSILNPLLLPYYEWNRLISLDKNRHLWFLNKKINSVLNCFDLFIEHSAMKTDLLLL